MQALVEDRVLGLLGSAGVLDHDEGVIQVAGHPQLGRRGGHVVEAEVRRRLQVSTGRQGCPGHVTRSP